MARKYKTILIVINLIFMFTIISIPAFLLFEEYSSSSRIDEGLIYMHTSATPPLRRELNLNADIGRIDINYATQPVNYLAKIEVIIEMGGSNLAGKSYLDFFNIVWQNTSSIVNFTMCLKAGIDQVELLTLIKEINIIVTLRRDVVFDININSKIQADVKITVPWKTSVGNILTNVSSGDIQYDLNYCLIEGNITMIIQETGDIELKTYDAKYTQNITWFLSSNNGDVRIEIYQINDMGANVTATIGTIIGNYFLTYIESIYEVGSYFVLRPDPDDFSFTQQLVEILGMGYTYDLYTVNGTDIYHLRSNDFPAHNNYYLGFSLPNGFYDFTFQSN